MQHNLFLLLFLFLLQTACTPPVPPVVDGVSPCLDCDPMQACTKTYNHLMVSIRDEKGDENIKLDNYFTIHIGTGDTISLMGSPHEEEMRRQVGRYPVVCDSQMKIIDGCGEAFLFVAEKDGRIVIREEYFILKDCCHVSEIQGNTDLVVLGCEDYSEVKICGRCLLVPAYQRVQLTDQIGEPVALDKHFTIRTSTQDTLRFRPIDAPMSKDITPLGTYIALSNLNPKHPCVEEYIFVGLKDGKEIVREPLFYRQGCCDVKGGVRGINVNL